MAPHVGDIGFDIILPVLKDGVALDISSATTKKFIIKGPRGKVLDVPAAFVTSGVDGKLHYLTVAHDLQYPGVYYVQAYLEMPGWTGHGPTVQFDVIKNLKTGQVQV